MNNGLSRSLYRETVQGSGVSDGKVIRQRDGTGVYAHVRVRVRALDRGQGTMLAWNAGLNLPAKFVSSVLQGIQDAMDAGVLAGLEMTDVSVSVEDGSYHEVDSTADAFREAARTATTEAIRQARPLILEALFVVTITVPANFVEDGDVTVISQGGKLRAATSEPESRTIAANVPASSLANLIAEWLRISGGCASVSSRNDGFRPKPEPPDLLGPWAAT